MSEGDAKWMEFSEGLKRSLGMENSAQRNKKNMYNSSTKKWKIGKCMHMTEFTMGPGQLKTVVKRKLTL